MIDLRSDTVTRPTLAMRQAMANAEVGDDVYGEDPTVNRLEACVADLLGKEAALFVPSGTMSNQIGIRVHCQQGDELLCDSECHIFHYEQAAYAQWFGVSAYPVTSVAGVPALADLQERVRGGLHAPRTKLMVLENTHNRRGGVVLAADLVRATCDWAASAGLARHLDGARIWNAAVATGKPLTELAAGFDTVSVCFSKGLGAPAGSMLTGTRDQIAFARRVRKGLGGGMRQAGVLAAAALHAIDHHWQRMGDDHARAARLAADLATLPGLTVTSHGPAAAGVPTNIVAVRVEPRLGTAAEFSARLKGHGVLTGAMARDRLRAVVHLDISDADIDTAIGAFREALAV